MINNTRRFSNRVEDYVKYRPKYPLEVINILSGEIGFNSTKIVADIGSGTGFSTELFLNNGNKVFAIEPNTEMRMACEELYGNYPNLVSINGTAETTTLNHNSVDIIFSGTAFHWFDQNKSKIEFERILKNNGHIVLAWNLRLESSEFLQQYDNLLITYGTDYKEIKHRNISKKDIEKFLAPKKVRELSIPNMQKFNLEGFLGRIRSSSYTPKSGKGYEILKNAATNLFNHYQKNNEVVFLYNTKIYWC